MPVTTGVVCDLGMAALVVLAARDMSAVGLAPRRSMATENIRDLQPWTCQQRRALGGRLVFGFVVRLLLGRVFDLVLLGPQWLEAVERAHDLADRVGGDVRVERCRLHLGMSQRTRVILSTSLRY